MLQRAHLGVLDMLRGLAALAVMLYHFTLPDRELHQFYLPGLARVFHWGFLGVPVFFVISGFVIPLSLSNAGYTIAGLGPYLRRRVVRLVPPAYASLLLVLAQWATADALVYHRLQLLGSLSVGRLLSNALFIVPFTGQGWINGVFWTLTVEFEYYLVLGLLFPLLFGPGRLWLFLVVQLLLAGAGQLPGPDIQNYFHYSVLFTLGSLTLLFYQGRLARPAYLALLAVFGGLAWLSLGPERALAGTGAALLIAFVPLRHPALGFLGRISYSLYLTHFAVGGAAGFLLSRLLPPAADWQRAGLIALSTALSLAVATVFYRWVERPFKPRAAALALPSTIAE